MRKDKQERLDRFIGFIDEAIAAGDPHSSKLVDGEIWAALPQPKWAKMLKVSTRTLRDLAKCHPIIQTKTIDDKGKPIALYRVGTTPHMSPRHLANVMAQLYRKKYNRRRVSRRDWGCLLHLAKLWPKGVQVDIFRTALNDVAAFKSAVKLADPDCSHTPRYYEWLPISLVRKYPNVALDVFIDKIQMGGHIPPPSILALSPEIWPKIKSIGKSP